MTDNRNEPVCVLLTDFPLTDPYVGVMKGVILSRVRGAHLVDLAHGLPPGNIAWGALLLQEQTRFFPERSVVLAVIDPGVGTDRPILAARSGGYRFVAPDNGLLHPVLQGLAGPGEPEVVHVKPAGVRLPGGCETFHGRDIMAPVAARLLAGEPLSALGGPASTWTPLTLPEAERVGDTWVGEVISADGYGNLITSLKTEALRGADWRVFLEGVEIGPIRPTFGAVSPGEVTAVFGSLNRVEVTVRDGSAAERFAAGPGNRVEARRPS
jgi:S-adenosylmethionine hydrolase